MASIDNYEFRSAKPEEMREFFKLERYVFADNRTPTPEEEAKDPLQPEMTTAAFQDGRTVATAGGFPFLMKFNGTTIPADGVTSVGTDPAFRRRGLVRKLITMRLEQAYEQKVPAAILWASLAAIYQRFGYGMASLAYKCKVDPRLTAFQFPEPSEGRCQLTSFADAKSVLKEVYESFIADRNLHLHRSEIHWNRIYKNDQTPIWVAMHYDRSNNPDGYCTYKLTETRDKIPGPDQKLTVREFVYLNRSAYRGLWEFIRSHDLAQYVEIWLPVDDPAFLFFLEPRYLDPGWREGLWLRVVDAEKLSQSRAYAYRGMTSFEITSDRECPWNVGRYTLDFDGESTQSARTQGEVEFQIDVNGLATLLCGNATLSQLQCAGRACISDPSRLGFLDGFFATKYKPFCSDPF